MLLTISTLIGLVAGWLTWTATSNAAPSVLAGGTAAAVTLDRLHRWTGS